MKFEFYVLNYDINKHRIIPYNIFNNIRVQQDTEAVVAAYLERLDDFIYTDLKGEFTNGFAGLCEAIGNIIRHEEWSRIEYEISVGDAFETDLDKFEKWDCYEQALPNIEIIARACIYQYNEYIKNK